MRNDNVYVLRESIVKVTQMLAGSGLEVTQRGVSASVELDPKTGKPIRVNLPYLPDNASEELCNAVQGFLDHEVAHLLFTDFETIRKANELGGQQLHQLLNMLEDPRVEKAMVQRYKGSAFNLDNVGEFFLKKFIIPEFEKAQASGDDKAAIQTLMVPLIRAMSGQLVFQQFMKDKMPLVAPLYEAIKDLAAKMEAAQSTEDCLALAQEINKRISEGRANSQAGSGDKREESESGRSSRAESAGGRKSGKAKPKSTPTPSKAKEESEEEEPNEGGETPKSGEEKGEPDESEEKESTGGEGDGEAPEEGAESEGGESEGKSSEEEEADESEENEEDGEGEDGADDEGESPSLDLSAVAAALGELDRHTANDFDKALSQAIADSAVEANSNAKYAPYSTDSDIIEPLTVGRGFNDHMLKELTNAVDDMVAPIQKDLERAVAARSLSVRSHGHRSGKLDPAGLVRLRFNDPRVFSRKQESRSKDVAVSLVIDMSGSMSGAKIHLAAQAAYALTSVLERLKIKSEAICFTTTEPKGGRDTYEQIRKEQARTGARFSRVEALYMPILKGFEEGMTAVTRQRFGWLPNCSMMRNNIDGECVEIAARRLLARKEKGKIMIVLSDGYPAGACDGDVLSSHLKSVVKRVSAAGIKTIGIGIHSDAVRKFYDKNVVINDIKELPVQTIKELRHLLLSD